MARRTMIVGVLASLFSLTLLVAPVALAHHKASHDRGPGQAKGHGGGSSSDHDGDADNDAVLHTEDDDGDGYGNADDPTPSQHPSGKDRFLEGGNGGNQGRSESDPDDSHGPMRREAPPCDDVTDPRGPGKCTDKPFGAGGWDIYDQDGNNGCGNDQDFDDDNNGWCGKPPTVILDVPPPPPCCGPGGGGDDFPVTVLSEDVERPTGGDEAPAEVLGARVQARPQTQAEAQAEAQAVGAGALPFTGAGVSMLLAAATALISAGSALMVRSRRK